MRRRSLRRHDDDHSLVRWPLTRPAGNPLGCDIQSRGPLAVVVIDGELDIDTAPGLGERVASLAAAGDHIILDLAAVRFCDCAGLSLFLRLRKQATDAGGSLQLARPATPVRRLISTARLSDVLPVTVSVDDALAVLDLIAGC